MKKLFSIIGLIGLATPLLAAKISDSQLELGKESSTDNKEILFNIGEDTGNPKIRANYGTKKLEFSNDGTNYLEFGTGDANGFNIIDNAGFESDLTNWTNTGSGSLSVDTDAADVYQGQKSALWDAAAANDVLASQAVTIPGGLRGNLCSVEVQYKGGDDNLKLQAYDGTNVLAEVALEASGNFSKAMVTLTCPSSGTLQGRLIASADAAAVNVDNWVVGKSADILTALDRKVYTKTCAPSLSISNATWTDLTCSTYLPAGRYFVKIMGVSRVNYSSIPTRMTSGMLISTTPTTYTSQGVGGFLTAYTETGAGVATDNLDFQNEVDWPGGELYLFGRIETLGGTVTGRTWTSAYLEATLLDEEVGNVQRVETSAWSVNTYDADFYTLPTTTQTEYFVTTNSNASITNTGSLDAKILCDGAVSTGTTCSGASEMSGIVFDAPRAGKVFICSYLNIFVSENSGSTNFRDIFTIFKVPADGSVSAGLLNTNWTGIENIGAARLEWTLANGGNSIKTDAVRVCGLTDVVAGSNAFLLATDIDALSGNPSTNQIRGIGFTVFPIEQQLPQALITQGRVYNSQIPAVTGLANDTDTFLGQAMYLPSGKYRFEVFGYLTVKFSVLPSRTFGLMFLSDKASGGGAGDIQGSGSEGLIQVRADILQDSFYHTYEADWSGGIIYVYGNIENVGGTVTTRDISNINITATRLN